MSYLVALGALLVGFSLGIVVMALLLSPERNAGDVPGQGAVTKVK